MLIDGKYSLGDISNWIWSQVTVFCQSAKKVSTRNHETSATNNKKTPLVIWWLIAHSSSSAHFHRRVPPSPRATSNGSHTAWRNHKKSALAVSNPFERARSDAPRKLSRFSFQNSNFHFLKTVPSKDSNTLRSTASVSIVESLASDLIFHFKGDFLFFKNQWCDCGWSLVLCVHTRTKFRGKVGKRQIFTWR